MTRILITNDDGIFSEGIKLLAEALADLGQVTVVAPDREQSASGHSLTLHRPLRLRKLSDHWYSVDGTPTDCVTLAVMGLLKEGKPDLVVSGINFGLNLGDDVTYSGTVSATFEGSLLGIPSVAFSQEVAEDFSFADASRFAHGFIGALLEEPLPRDLLFNVNIPAGVETGTRIRLAGEGDAGLRGGPAGDLYIFLSIKPHEFFQRDGADIFCKVPIAMTTAALGGQIDVPTVEGSITRVKVPEGTETGKQFRLRGKGMPVLRSKVTGDMYIQVDVETPKNLTRRQRELLEEFEKESHKETSPHSAGFFARMKEFFEGKG